MLFRTRRLKGLGSSGQGVFSASALKVLDNKTRFFRKMARTMDTGTLDRRSEKHAMSDALLAMAKNKKGITTQDVANQLVKWKRESGDEFNRKEARALTRDFQKMGVEKWELRKAKKNYFREKAEEKRNRIFLARNERDENKKDAGNERKESQKKFFGKKGDRFTSSPEKSSSASAHPILSRIRGVFRNQPPPPATPIPRRPMF